MGFEVHYSYHDRREDGGYNTDEKKKMKKKVGDPYEEVDTDKLAGAVMAQLARRDIWVTDVEIFELAKKKVTFREGKGSVIIKNKKYMMDGSTAQIVGQEVAEMGVYQPDPSQSATMHHGMMAPPSVAMQTANAHPHNGGTLRPIKWVVFQPSYQTPEQKRKVSLLRFTVDKKYPVFSEQLQANGVGMAYKTIDDLSREQLVSDEYFVSAEAQLFADRELGFSEPPEKRDGGKLLWHGTDSDMPMPKLR